VLLRGTAIVSSLTLVSRILGFVRDLLVARLLGTSVFADAFFVAFRIPNLLRSFVAEGALTSAFTPVFASSLGKSKDHARKAMQRIMALLLSITGALTALIIVVAPDIVSFLAPGFEHNQEQFQLCIKLTRIMAPYVLCISVVAMLNAALNSLNIFGTSAWAQVTMNMVLIVGGVIAIPYEPADATAILAWSALLGGVIQIATQIPSVMRAGLSLVPSFQLLSREVVDVVKLMIPATIGASVYQVTIFLATILASLLPSGSVSWLFYADRVAQFPLGIFSIALASVLLPALSNASARSDAKGFTRNIDNSLRFTSFCILPMSAGIWALAVPITEVLFERGAFTPESTLQTSRALRALCFGLWASSCHSMLVRAFIARKDTITPTCIGGVSLLVNVVVSLILMGPLVVHEPSNAVVTALASIQSLLQGVLPTRFSLGHVGLACASTISTLLSLALTIAIFSTSIGNFPWRSFARSTFQSLLASLTMVWVIHQASPLFASAGALCIGGALIGAFTFCVASFILRSSEFLEASRLLRFGPATVAPVIHKDK
jgi:putative peptidoglycan lipid II flippase